MTPSPWSSIWNKLTALVGRQEERDIVDVCAFEEAGYDLERALSDALTKDGGCTPATLARLLKGIQIPDGVTLPGGADPERLRAYVSNLTVRMRQLAAPK